MNKTLATTKNFVARHKTAVTVAVTAITVTAIHQVGLKQHNEFLKEHGLFDLYYHPEG